MGVSIFVCLLVCEDPPRLRFPNLTDTHVDIFSFSSSRPLIKHIIMAYGVDVPTQAGYIYNKKYELDGSGSLTVANNETGGAPDLKIVLMEHAGGDILAENMESTRGGIAGAFMGKNKKPEIEQVEMKSGKLAHSGDGSVPYLSLSWAHTWYVPQFGQLSLVLFHLAYLYIFFLCQIFASP